ncbi:MAG: hypothetical protein WAJ85_06305 [Candidatus Baltobacteraceae bacterium]
MLQVVPRGRQLGIDARTRSVFSFGFGVFSPFGVAEKIVTKRAISHDGSYRSPEEFELLG